MTAVEGWVPESLQQMIEKQIERLSPAGPARIGGSECGRGRILRRCPWPPGLE